MYSNLVLSKLTLLTTKSCLLFISKVNFWYSIVGFFVIVSSLSFLSSDGGVTGGTTIVLSSFGGFTAELLSITFTDTAPIVAESSEKCKEIACTPTVKFKFDTTFEGIVIVALSLSTLISFNLKLIGSPFSFVIDIDFKSLLLNLTPVIVMSDGLLLSKFNVWFGITDSVDVLTDSTKLTSCIISAEVFTTFKVDVTNPPAKTKAKVFSLLIFLFLFKPLHSYLQ